MLSPAFGEIKVTNVLPDGWMLLFVGWLMNVVPPETVVLAVISFPCSGDAPRDTYHAPPPRAATMISMRMMDMNPREREVIVFMKEMVTHIGPRGQIIPLSLFSDGRRNIASSHYQSSFVHSALVMPA